MNNILLQSVGIDMAKEKFDVCFKESKTGSAAIKGTKSFTNNHEGFKAFLEWCNKRRKKTSSLLFVMEATGVYYEELCYFLHSLGEEAVVELPQKIKYYAKSLNIKTKTDKVDAKLIAEIGIERNASLKRWSPPSEQFKEIRDITRELARLKKAKTAMSSQLHAMNTAHGTSMDIIDTISKHIIFTQKLTDDLEKVLIKTVKKDKELYERVARIEKVKGLGIPTILKVLAETNGFLLFDNIRQLVSYAGLDVVQDQSGKRSGKTRISKKGNAHLRQALYMSAVTAGNHNPTLIPFYERLKERLPAKKQGIVAVMRKLLILIYTLWRTGEEYDPNYQWQGGKRKREVSLPLSR